MKRALYRFALLFIAGGAVFQATASCTDQLVQTVAASLTEAVSAAVTSAITNATQTGGAT